MISRLRGTVLSVKPPAAIIDVSGVGFRVSCSQAALDLLEAGRTVDLHTHLIVREEELSLYGFATEEEVALFQTLIGVSGIGPRTGLAMLSKLQPEALRAAIINDRADIISRVPGVGKKTAEKIIFALKDKLGGLDAAPAMPASALDAEVISALTSLGYSISEAQTALGQLPRGEKMDLEEKIRRALAYFA